MAWSSPLRAGFALISAVLLTVGCGTGGLTSSTATTTTTTTTPTTTWVQPHGERTDLDGIIERELPVYAEPFPGYDYDQSGKPTVEAPPRKWTLLPMTKVKVLCQVIFPEVRPGSADLYVSWAPDQYGFIEAVEITTRTPDTNERITDWELKLC